MAQTQSTPDCCEAPDYEITNIESDDLIRLHTKCNNCGATATDLAKYLETNVDEDTLPPGGEGDEVWYRVSDSDKLLRAVITGAHHSAGSYTIKIYDSVENRDTAPDSEVLGNTYTIEEDSLLRME